MFINSIHIFPRHHLHRIGKIRESVEKWFIKILQRLYASNAKRQPTINSSWSAVWHRTFYNFKLGWFFFLSIFIKKKLRITQYFNVLLHTLCISGQHSPTCDCTNRPVDFCTQSININDNFMVSPGDVFRLFFGLFFFFNSEIGDQTFHKNFMRFDHHALFPTILFLDDYTVLFVFMENFKWWFKSLIVIFRSIQILIW